MSLHVKLIKINFMKKILLIAMLIIVANNVKAHDFEVDGYYYNFVSIPDLTVALTYKGEYDDYYWENISPSYSGDVTIPKTVEYLGKTFNVIGINANAFANCNIGTLTIPNTIQGVCAFGGDDYNGLHGTFKNLVIEDGDIFINCNDALIAEDVTESVYIGRHIGEYGDSPIVHYDDNRYIGGGSYKKIIFSDKLTRLGEYCKGCYNLTEVTIPESVKELYGTFTDCTNLKKISAPGVEWLGGLSGTALENIDFPNLRVINRSCFYGCKNLKNVIVPEGVISVGRDAFGGCENLESLTLPGTVVEFGGITGCKSLKTISLCNPTPVTSGYSDNSIDFDSEMFLNTTVKVPAGSLEAYRNAEVWKGFFNIEEDASLVSNIFTVYFDELLTYTKNKLSIKLSDEVLPDYEGYRLANKGSSITIEFVPQDKWEEGYKITYLAINGQDVTADVVDNKYTTVVDGNICIEGFGYGEDDEYVEPKDPYLSIKQADNGCVKMKVDRWDSYEFFIVPTEGWSIHTVTLNGADVTSEVDEDGRIVLSDIKEDAVLNVVFESTESAIDNLVKSHVKVYAKANALQIEGADAGDKVMIYTDGGMLVESFGCKSSSVEVPLEHGTYIVKVNDKVIKVLL